MTRFLITPLGFRVYFETPDNINSMLITMNLSRAIQHAIKIEERYGNGKN